MELIIKIGLLLLGSPPLCRGVTHAHFYTGDSHRDNGRLFLVSEMITKAFFIVINLYVSQTASSLV